MFFEEIKLSKKAWHYKLMSATFAGDPPKLWSFCPYFWLTIFCMLVSPITLFVYLVGVWPVRGMMSFYNSKAMQRFDAWLDKLDERRYGELLEDPYELYSQMPKMTGLGQGKRRNLALEKICAKQGVKMYKDKYENEYTDEFIALRAKWRIEYDKIREENRVKYAAQRHAEWEKEQNEYKAKRVRKAKIEAFCSPFERFGNWVVKLFTVTKIVIWTKRIVSTAITLGGLYVLYFFGKMWYDYASIRPVNWVLIKEIFSIVGIVVVVILGIIAIAFGIAMLIERLKKNDSTWFDKLGERLYNFFVRISPPFIIIWKALVWIFKAIIKPFHFFILYFKAWKSDNCPAIIWDEESAK